MLNLSLSAVERGEVKVEGEIPPDAALLDDSGLALAEPLRVELRARTVGEGVLVRGHILARLGLECRRCLAPVDVEVDDAFDMLFEPVEGTEEAAELDGEVYPLPARGDVLDLGPALREQLLLRVPEHVVCDEACRGLCPQCGADLNRTTCDCVPERPSSPWDALKDLKFD